MGAGVSTEGAPLTRVKCKDNIGVLFDPEAEKAFAAAATGPDDELAVPWADVDAYVKQRDAARLPVERGGLLLAGPPGRPGAPCSARVAGARLHRAARGKSGQRQSPKKATAGS